MNPRERRYAWLLVLLAFVLVAASCGDDDDGDTAAAETTAAAAEATAPPAETGGGDIDYSALSGELIASGASFPDAFYQAAIEEFITNVASDLNVTYNAVGSGTGKEEFGNGLTDFAGSDSLVKEGDGPVAGEFYYLPTVAAPITVSYNLPVEDLQLSATTLASIMQGDITSWDDPTIAEDNPDASLPSEGIIIVHRADGSGTTSNFTKYLDQAAAGTWTLGAGDTVAWPASSQAGQKNTGVAQLVKDNEGAIGYVDLSDAIASGLTFASIKNRDGNFIQPTLEGVTAGLEGAEVADDLTYNPLDAAGPDAYPITAPTYILMKVCYDDQTTLDNVVGFLTWLDTDGQAIAESVDFAPLPASLQEKALAQIAKVTLC